MGYYGNTRHARWSTSRSFYASSKYGRLCKLFGGAVDEIKKQFLTFDEGEIDELFIEYGALYGQAAEQYARKTFAKWKVGEVRLSGQTMERLIDLVPPLFNPGQRFSILKLVLKRHKQSGVSHIVKINIKEPSQGFSELQSALASMSHEAVLAHLPEAVMDAASWLYDDDITAARAMLAQAVRAENDLIRSSALREIDLLKKAISSGQVKAATYRVEMPAGTLNVVAYSSSMCFVATACFGQDAPETAILRAWRDRYLIERSWGRQFIVWYYNNGERFAALVARSPVLKRLAKMVVGRLAHAVETIQSEVCNEQ